jgi:mRNA interferase RelE/StbE
LIGKSEPKREKLWTVEFDDRARRELRKLDSKIQKKILRYMRERLAGSEDPRRLGKPLRRNLAGLWRYRIEDYRLICRLEDNRVVVLVLEIGHRSNGYED